MSNCQILSLHLSLCVFLPPYQSTAKRFYPLPCDLKKETCAALTSTHWFEWTGYAVLDASRPWLVYWTIHSLEMLNQPIGPEHQQSCIDLLSRCQSSTGGFGGGPGQLPHLAPTYASVNSLATIGTPEALALIDRPSLYTWLLRMKKPDGAFTMHQDGENDVRTMCVERKNERWRVHACVYRSNAKPAFFPSAPC